MTVTGNVLGAMALLALGMPPAAAPAPAAPAPQASDCYRTFWPSGHDVEIEACEYRGGGSGYTILRNNSRHDMYVCWTLEYGSGKTSRGCNFRIRAGDEAKSSCYSCNRKQDGGLVDVTWRTVKRSD